MKQITRVIGWTKYVRVWYKYTVGNAGHEICHHCAIGRKGCLTKGWPCHHDGYPTLHHFYLKEKDVKKSYI